MVDQPTEQPDIIKRLKHCQKDCVGDKDAYLYEVLGRAVSEIEGLRKTAEIETEVIMAMTKLTIDKLERGIVVVTIINEARKMDVKSDELKDALADFDTGLRMVIKSKNDQ